jgi:hypothetical protein
MKQTILLLVALVTTVSTFGQSDTTAQAENQPFVDFRGKTMISIFAGGYAAQKNGNNHGDWYGMYLEHLPIRFLFSEYDHLDLGVCTLASKSVYQGNDETSKYSSTNYEFGLGLAGGFYNYRFFKSSAFYLGANTLIKDGQEIEDGSTSTSTGRYLSKEGYLMLSSELNLNVMKTYESGLRILPRTQLRLIYQKPLKIERDAYWNATPLSESGIWDKTAYMSEFKMSIYRFGESSFFEPKLVAAYHYYEGDKSQWAIGGIEFALRKLNWDDFLSISFTVKRQVGNYSSNLNDTQFTFGLNFMPFNFRR